jgi:hypothetical protein
VNKWQRSTAASLAVNEFLCSGIGDVNTIFVGVGLKKKKRYQHYITR